MTRSGRQQVGSLVDLRVVRARWPGGVLGSDGLKCIVFRRTALMVGSGHAPVHWNVYALALRLITFTRSVSISASCRVRFSSATAPDSLMRCFLGFAGSAAENGAKHSPPMGGSRAVSRDRILPELPVHCANRIQGPEGPQFASPIEQVHGRALLQFDAHLTSVDPEFARFANRIDPGHLLRCGGDLDHGIALWTP